MKHKKNLKEIMTKNLTVINLETSFRKIKEIFSLNNFHHLPVVDDLAVLKGIISKHDFTKLAYQISTKTSGKTYSNKTYDHLTAKDLMTANPVSLSSDDQIELAADLFLENVYHAIPILDDGVLVGIVTAHDLLAFAFYQTPVGEN